MNNFKTKFLFDSKLYDTINEYRTPSLFEDDLL